jgi:prephenate dehydrogenase
MLNKKDILVTGYKGEIGSFILSGLLRVMPKALNIWCIDVNETKEEVRERIEKADTIFLCIPIDKTIDWMVKHKELLKGKVIIEQTSLKDEIRKNKDVQGLDIRSMHILFRPSQTPNLEDRKVGLVRKDFDDSTANVMANLTQSEIVWYEDVESHDREMATAQALVHRTLLVLGGILGQCSGSTYVSEKVIELSDRIKKGDVGLYKAIQDNKRLPERLEELRNGLDEFDIERYM